MLDELVSTPRYRMTTISNGQVTAEVTRDVELLPVLQKADGKYIGTITAGGPSGMVTFDNAGNITQMAGAYGPAIATADGGVMATTYSGQALTFDQYGNVTGQMASLPVQSWRGNQYEVGSVLRLASIPTSPAPSFWAFGWGNASAKGTAAVHYEPPQSGLRTLASTDLPAQPACNAFLDNLTAIAKSNGRDPLGSNFTKTALITEIHDTASAAVEYVYDGPSSNTLWEQCTEPFCAAKFPVWFTGEQKTVSHP